MAEGSVCRSAMAARQQGDNDPIGHDPILAEASGISAERREVGVFVCAATVGGLMEEHRVPATRLIALRHATRGDRRNPRT
jgi:hypothetical protein